MKIESKKLLPPFLQERPTDSDSDSLRIWIVDAITTERERSEAKQTQALILYLSVTKMSCSPLALTKLTHQ